MAQATDIRLQGLPVNPLILLPDGWMYKPPDWLNTSASFEETLFEILDNQCFSSAIYFALDHPNSPIADTLRRPQAVSWFKLEVTPGLKNDVVAVVLPLVGWKRTETINIGPSSDNSDSPCYVEIHHCMREWKLTQLLNLRIIVALPWPDLIPHVENLSHSYGEGYFMDLRCFAKKGISVTVLPNLYEDAARELLLTLLILTQKGFNKDDPPPIMELHERNTVSLESPPKSEKPSPNAAKPPTGSLLQLPKKAPTKSTQPVTGNRNVPTSQVGLSTTAPPSLTLATNQICSGAPVANWVIRSGIGLTAMGYQRSLKELSAGFLGITTESAKQTALLLKNGFGMRVMYHQRIPLSDLEGIDFEHDLPTFLYNNDVIILMDDCADRRICLTKALKSRSPIRQKPTRRSRYCLQEEDFRYFKPTAIFISTSPVESFSFTALAQALRNQTLSGAAFTIPLDGSLSYEELHSLYHMSNVLAVPPPSTAGFSPKSLRRQLASLVLQTLSCGLGLPYLGSVELEVNRELRTISSTKSKTRGLQSLAAGFRRTLKATRRSSRQERSESLSLTLT